MSSAASTKGFAQVRCLLKIGRRGRPEQPALLHFQHRKRVRYGIAGLRQQVTADRTPSGAVDNAGQDENDWAAHQ